MVGGYDYGLFLGYGFRFSFHGFICVGGRTFFGGWIGIILRSDILKRIFLTWFLGECILILSRLLVTLTPLSSKGLFVFDLVDLP